MSDNSKIEWTDATWNAVRGCTKISPGCTHCYAETFAERFRGVPGHPFEFGFDLRLVPEKLAEPLRWPKAKMIFVNSMSDLFHEKVPDDYIVAVGTVMAKANWHTYQVLTKRAERLRELLSGKLRFAAKLPHVWWGVSVENRRHGLPRVNQLRAAPAQVRFLSIEPLLEDLGQINLSGINWVIVGARGGFGYVCYTPVFQAQINDVHFHLIYATRSDKGLEVFKKEERKAVAVMESARAKAQQRERESGGTLELLSSADMHDTQFYNSLRTKYWNKAESKIRHHLSSKKPVQYDLLWETALTTPLLWVEELNEFLLQLKKDGELRFTGAGERERFPKHGKGVLVQLS